MNRYALMSVFILPFFTLTSIAYADGRSMFCVQEEKTLDSKYKVLMKSQKTFEDAVNGLDDLITKVNKDEELSSDEHTQLKKLADELSSVAKKLDGNVASYQKALKKYNSCLKHKDTVEIIVPEMGMDTELEF